MAEEAYRKRNDPRNRGHQSSSSGYPAPHFIGEDNPNTSLRRQHGAGPKAAGADGGESTHGGRSELGMHEASGSAITDGTTTTCGQLLRCFAARLRADGFARLPRQLQIRQPTAVRILNIRTPRRTIFRQLSRRSRVWGFRAPPVIEHYFMSFRALWSFAVQSVTHGHSQCFHCISATFPEISAEDRQFGQPLSKIGLI